MDDATIGNQQITTAEIGWLAGIIDGEGNLDLNRRCGLRRPDKGTWNWDRPRIIIGNTDATMIQKISEIYSKIGCKFWYSLLKRKQETHKTCMLIITIGTGNVGKVLSIIYPYLTSKKLQAEVLLDYCNWRTKAMQSKKKEDWMWGVDSVGTYSQLMKDLKQLLPNPLELSRKANTPLSVGISETIRGNFPHMCEKYDIVRPSVRAEEIGRNDQSAIA